MADKMTFEAALKFEYGYRSASRRGETTISCFSLRKGSSGSNLAADHYRSDIVASVGVSEKGFESIVDSQDYRRKSGSITHYEVAPGGWALVHSSVSGWEWRDSFSGLTFYCTTQEQVRMAFEAGWLFDLRPLGFGREMNLRLIAAKAIKEVNPLEWHACHLVEAAHIGCGSLGQAMAFLEPDNWPTWESNPYEPPYPRPSFVPRQWGYCCICGKVLPAKEFSVVKQLTEGIDLSQVIE
jgi:hypothetical protein